MFLLALNYKAFWEGFVRLRCSVERWFNVVWILASSLGKSFRSTKLLIYSQNVFSVLKIFMFCNKCTNPMHYRKKYKIIFDIIAHFNRNKVTIWRCPIYTDFLLPIWQVFIKIRNRRDRFKYYVYISSPHVNISHDLDWIHFGFLLKVWSGVINILGYCDTMALKKVKGTLERVLDKNLQDLVRGIRNHKENEVGW